MTALTLAIADLRAADDSNIDNQIALITAHLGRRPADDEPVPFLVWMQVPSKASTEDAIWALRCAQPAEDARRVAAHVAIASARRVEHLLDDATRPAALAAIAAAEAWLAEPSAETADTAWDAKVAAAEAATPDAAACYAAIAASYAAKAATADATSATGAAWAAAEAAAWAAAKAATKTDWHAAAVAARTDAWAAVRADLVALLSA